MAARRRTATSAFTENSEVTDTPRPASTNFFIASVFPSSIAARAVTPAQREPRVDLAPDGAAAIEQDQRMFRQLGGRDGAVPPPARQRWGDGHELVAVERRHGQLAIAQRQAHQPDIEVVGHEAPRDLRRRARDHDQIDRGKARAKAPQRPRQQIDADRGAGPEPYATRHDAAQLLHVLDARL